jgi:2'-5' RNA ligase
MKTSDFSFWLIPEEEEKQKWQKVIDDLAKRYQVYSFIPHITIYWLGEVNVSVKTIVKKTEEIASFLKPISLKPLRVDYSEIFTKTLFIQFEKNNQSINVYQKFKEKFSSYNVYDFNPHLSLIYKNQMPVLEKEKIKKEIKLPKSIKFNQLMVILNKKGTIKKEKDVLNWEIVYSKKT